MKNVDIGIIVAMKEEADIIAQSLNLQPIPSNGKHLLYQSSDKKIILITPGTDSGYLCFGNPVCRVGKVSAGIITTLLVERYKPKLLINAGTAGGIKSAGMEIGDIVLADSVTNHDMRFGHMEYAKFGKKITPLLGLEKLSYINKPYKKGLVSSGDAFITLQEEWKIIKENNAVIKDMEAAGIVQALEILSVDTPLYILKAVTDLTDEHVPDSTTDFISNLKKAMTALTEILKEIVDNKSTNNGYIIGSDFL